MFNFVVSVNNCIRMSHYRLTMLQAMHEKRITVFEVESISRIDHAFTAFYNYINRNGIPSGDSRFIVCVPRTLNTDVLCNESELYYRTMLKKLIDDQAERYELKCEISLIIVDYYKDKAAYDKLIDLDRKILETGNCPGSKNIPDFSGLQITDFGAILRDPSDMIEAATANITSPVCKSFYIECLNALIDYLRDPEILLPDAPSAKDFFHSRYEDHFSNLFSETGDSWKHTVLRYKICYANSLDERQDMLALVAFLQHCAVSATPNGKNEKIKLSQKDINAFSAKKTELAGRFGSALLQIKQRFLKPTFLPYESGHFIRNMRDINHDSAQKAEDRLNEYKVKLSDILVNKKLRGIISAWPELHKEITHAVRCAPELVSRYSGNMVEVSSKAIPSRKAEPLCPNDVDKKEYFDELQYKKETLTESLMPEATETEDPFSRQMRLNKQLEHTDKVLSYMNSCIDFIKLKGFLKLWAFSSVTFALIYLIAQAKILFTSKTGVITYASVCVLIAAALLLSYMILNIWYSVRIKRLVTKLSKQIDSYFEQYIDRVKSFEARMNNIINLENTNQRMTKLIGENEKNDDYGRRVSWHERQISEYLDDALVYFDSLMPAGIDNPETSAKAIDPYIDDIGNEFYWITDDWWNMNND